MRELRHGVKLKKVQEQEFNPLPTEFQLTPFEMLMQDIRARNYKLRKVMVRAAPATGHARRPWLPRPCRVCCSLTMCPLHVAPFLYGTHCVGAGRGSAGFWRTRALGHAALGFSKDFKCAHSLDTVMALRGVPPTPFPHEEPR